MNINPKRQLSIRHTPVAEFFVVGKQVPVKLSRGEEHFQKVFDKMTIGVAIIDSAENFEYCNPAYCNLTGYSLSELKQLNMTRLLHPDDVNHHQIQISQLVEGVTTSFMTESRYLLKTAQPVWVSEYGLMLPRDNCQTIRLMIIVIDISDIKCGDFNHQSHNKNLITNESILTVMPQTMSQLVWVTDKEGTIHKANSSWLAYIGDQETPHKWFSSIHPDDRFNSLTIWEQAIQKQTDFTVECRLRDVELSYRWWKICGTLIQNDPHQSPNWLGICTDIHELKREEKIFKRLSSLFSLLWQSPHELQNGLQQMLAAVMEMFEADTGKIQILADDGTLQTVAEQEFQPDLQKALPEFSYTTVSEWVLRTGTRQIVENINPSELFLPYQEMMQKAGYRSMQCTPISSCKGSPMGVISTYFHSLRHWDAFELNMLDVYVQQIAHFIEYCPSESGLDQSKKSLKTRTQKLNEALVAAEKASAVKTQFLNAANHDLRQPLQAAELYLSVLARGLELSDYKPLCNDLKESLNMMGSIVNALLDISKLESGNIIPSKCDFLCSDLLNRLVVNVAPQANAKGLVLKFQPCGHALHSDPKLFERIISNLIDNAIKYTDQGQITVSCECNDSIARIRVEDTGIGISEDHIALIFQTYYQINNSDRYMKDSLGLGLAIVKYLVDILDISLSVTSTLGKGTVFSVEVPLGHTLVSQTASRPQCYIPLSTINSLENVLFIDDDPIVRKAVKTLFDTYKIQGHFFSNGEEALHAVNNGLRPTQIISDYQLPDLDGIEIVQRIRRLVGIDLPALIINGNTHLTQGLEKQLKNGQVLSKPLQTDRLLELIISKHTHTHTHTHLKIR